MPLIRTARQGVEECRAAVTSALHSPHRTKKYMLLSYENGEVVLYDYYNHRFVGRGGAAERSQLELPVPGAGHSSSLKFALRMVRTETGKKLRKAYEGGRYTTGSTNTEFQKLDQTGCATLSQPYSRTILSCALRTRAYAGIPQRLEIGGAEIANSLTTAAKDSMVIELTNTTADGISPSIRSSVYKLGNENFLPGGFGGDTRE